MEWILQGRLLSVFTVWSNFTEVRYCIYTELIPESEEGDPEAQMNAAILTEAPDQSPEEPKANLDSDYREGKPWT